jgi:hypothetical protein
MADFSKKRLAGCGQRLPDTSNIGHRVPFVHGYFVGLIDYFGATAPRLGFYRAKRQKVFLELNKKRPAGHGIGDKTPRPTAPGPAKNPNSYNLGT